MFTRFVKEARTVVVRAREEAAALGSSTLEAEHLLLALVGRPALDEAGLDRDAILTALDEDLEQSLAAVGVSMAALGVPAPVALAETPEWGASAKYTLERSLEEALARKDNYIGPDHILLAVLRPELGTVARALDRAGVDRKALARSID